jgi:hypothetical protein
VEGHPRQVLAGRIKAQLGVEAASLREDHLRGLIPPRPLRFQ